MFIGTSPTSCCGTLVLIIFGVAFMRVPVVVVVVLVRVAEPKPWNKQRLEKSFVDFKIPEPGFSAPLLIGKSTVDGT